jgi:hypothetical protein
MVTQSAGLARRAAAGSWRNGGEAGARAAEEPKGTDTKKLVAAAFSAVLIIAAASVEHPACFGGEKPRRLLGGRGRSHRERRGERVRG